MTVKLGTTHPRAPGVFSQLHRTQSKRVFNESIVCKAWSVAVKAGLPYVLFLSVLKKSTNMLHLIWTDIQSVVQLKTQLLLKIKPLWDCVCCCTSTSTTECFTVWLYMQNPHFFACSRRCALPLAWTESNSSQLVFKCTAQNEYLTSQISRELTWIFFFHINFSRFFRLYGYSRRSVCVSLHA